MPTLYTFIALSYLALCWLAYELIGIVAQWRPLRTAVGLSAHLLHGTLARQHFLPLWSMARKIWPRYLFGNSRTATTHRPCDDLIPTPIRRRAIYYQFDEPLPLDHPSHQNAFANAHEIPLASGKFILVPELTSHLPAAYHATLLRCATIPADK